MRRRTHQPDSKEDQRMAHDLLEEASGLFDQFNLPNAPIVIVALAVRAGVPFLVKRAWVLANVDAVVPQHLQEFAVEFLGQGVTVVAKQQSKNILKISDPREKWPMIMQLLDVMDVPQPQVYVEAKIIEIKYDTNLEFGF